MPAYSFKERFVPMILDGSKQHTIRARRKKGFTKIGDTLYLYFGLRTKWCKKLREVKCNDVRTIVITDESIVLFNKRYTDEEFNTFSFIKLLFAEAQVLSDSEANHLAWMDGFRPDGSTLLNSAGAFELMNRWWKQTHTELPFIGDIIYWDPWE